MRILLDECVPARLARELPGHDVTTVSRRRWSGVADPRLLRAADSEFDVFITVDQAVEHQLPRDIRMAIVTLFPPSNEIRSIRPLIPEVLEMLASLQPGDRVRIGR